MIADLRADSSRWEADISRREQQGFARGSYNQDLSNSRSPNKIPVPYDTSAIHESRQATGPSPHGTYVPNQTYNEGYTQSGTYASMPSMNPTAGYPGYGNQPGTIGGANPYAANQTTYTNQQQPPVSEPQRANAYTYAQQAGYTSYNDGRTAPRYQGFENEPDYPPVTTTISYPPTTSASEQPPVNTWYAQDYQERPQSKPTQRRDGHRGQH
jgi:hypothetical protein